jgi:phage terminase small subunit
VSGRKRALSVVESRRRAPQHLSEEMRRWWRAVADGWQLDGHHELLLTKAAEAWDRAEMARLQIERDGMTVEGRFGPKLHPLLAVERDAKVMFSRLVRQLDLDEPPPPGRWR